MFVNRNSYQGSHSSKYNRTILSQRPIFSSPDDKKKAAIILYRSTWLLTNADHLELVPLHFRMTASVALCRYLFMALNKLVSAVLF